MNERLTQEIFLLKERYDQLAIREFNPKNPNVYRGIFPLVEGKLSHKEGYDMGEDFNGETAEESMRRKENPLMGDTPKLKLSGERQQQADKFYEVRTRFLKFSVNGQTWSGKFITIADQLIIAFVKIKRMTQCL